MSTSPKYLEYTIFGYWHDVRIKPLHLGRHMGNVPDWFNIGSIFPQYGCATRDASMHQYANFHA